VTASFNEANQLTGSTSNGASSSYGYDGNGNRTTQNENGVTTDFTYQTDNRLTGVTRNGRSSSYAYDGLGRQLDTTETSGLGSQTTKSVWNGTSIVQQSNPASGTSALMRDAFGEVALQTADGMDASWALLDELGTTAAQAVGGSVAQLSTFDDWGIQSFDTIGWNSAVNYTGETTDAGYGLNNYYSRTYDPTTGSWMSQDSWRGLLTEPQTAARYGYVTNSPSTFSDYLGYCGGGRGGVPMCPGPRGGHSQGTGSASAPLHQAPIAQMISRDDDIDSVQWNGPLDDGTQDPSDDYSAMPARHVQGFDEGFPGYIPMLPEFNGGFGAGVRPPVRPIGDPRAAIVDSWYDANGTQIILRAGTYDITSQKGFGLAKVTGKHGIYGVDLLKYVTKNPAGFTINRAGNHEYRAWAQRIEVDSHGVSRVLEEIEVVVVINPRTQDSAHGVPLSGNAEVGVLTAYCRVPGGATLCPSWVEPALDDAYDKSIWGK
jgi:RHS repeat-associated protein